MNIRRANTSDVEGLLELWKELSEAGHEADRRYQIRQNIDDVMVEAISVWCTDEQPAWVAEIDGALAGFVVVRRSPPHPVLVTPETLVVTDAYVSDRFRRQGTGSALFGAVRDFAAQSRVAFVEVGTLALDERAMAFWRSQGFDDWRVTLAQELTPNAG